MSSSNSTVLGVLLMTRHGDRQGFYQNPDTYTASDTVITPLGENQLFQVGSELRARYLNQASPDFIQGISPEVLSADQIKVQADGGGEGGVIVDSATALLQGMWPPTTASNDTLSNGTTVVSPLSGMQYVQVNTVLPADRPTLEGWTSCPAFDEHTSAFYNSSEFQDLQSRSSSFIQKINGAGLMEGRQVALKNMWNIFDYANVQNIHNATFAGMVNQTDGDAPGSTMGMLRDLANYHEYGTFSSNNASGVGNIAAQVLIPSTLSTLSTLSNTSTSQPVKFSYTSISYKPFLSLFNLSSPVPLSDPTLSNPNIQEGWRFDQTGIVDYASAMLFEVRNNDGGGDPVVRTMFRNGTNGQFATLGLFGQTGDVPLSDFEDKLGPVGLPTTSSWCDQCQSTTGICTVITAANSSSNSHARWRGPISPVGAGFLGAGLTVAVIGMLGTTLILLGLLGFGKKRKAGNGSKGLGEKHMEEGSLGSEHADHKTGLH